MLRPVPGPDEPEGAGSPACALGICDGSGWILQDDDTTVPCRCREGMIGRAQSKGMGTGIPKRFRGVSFDRKPIVDLNPFVLRHVRRFVEQVGAERGRRQGAVVRGRRRDGQDVAGHAGVEGRRAERAAPSRSTRSPGCSRRSRTPTTASTGASYMKLFRRLCAVDLLQLDDLGAEKRTDWVLEQLYSIVNERWQDERSIVVTTNITDMDELREQVGARTVSRLAEICDEPLPIMGDGPARPARLRLDRCAGTRHSRRPVGR